MAARQQDTVRVWDLPIRLFHWVLVVAVAIATLTGYVSPEWWMGVHLWAGYVIVLLLVFRLVWGCLAPNTAALRALHIHRVKWASICAAYSYCAHPITWGTIQQAQS